MTIFKRLLLPVPFLLLLLAPGSAQAETAAPGWEVTSSTFPTDLAPSGGTGAIEVNVYNIGSAGSNGTVTVTDTLPPGVVATEAGDAQNGALNTIGEFGLWDCVGVGTSLVTCTNTELMRSLPIPNVTGSQNETGSGSIEHIAIAVRVQTAEAGTLLNHVTVSGGGAPAPASTSAPVTIASAPASTFGLQDSDGWFSNADGTIDTQAGSHPYEFTYSFDLSTRFKPNALTPSLEPAGGEARNFALALPPGLIGNPTAVPQCTRQSFEEETCSPSTQIGIDIIDAEKGGSQVPIRVAVPVYNLVPPPGLPAQFGFEFKSLPTYLDAGVRSGGDYGITEHVDDIAQKEVTGNRITIWGEPADPSHDQDRYSYHGDQERCLGGCASGAPRIPFLTLPTSCGPASQAPVFTATATSWETGGLAEASFLAHDGSDAPAGFTGCDQLGFSPTISVAPDTAFADTPAGLTVDVKVPQEGLATPGTLATSNIKDTTVVLPSGVVINPGQAAGLQACQAGPTEPQPSGELRHPGRDNLSLPGENGEEERFDGPANCPNASKVGTVQITTPLLKENLEGDVYVLQSNPPHLRLLIAASGEGVNIKLVAETSLCEKAGEELDGKTCEAAGQIVTKVINIPEAPVTDFKLSFSGGAQAALATPVQCESYTTTSDFTPWSAPEVPDAFPSSNFAIDGGPAGSGCPSSQLPFAPSLITGATNPKGGAFTNFSLLLQNSDGQLRTEKLQLKLPPGLAGMLSSVALCPEPQASSGECSEASKLGHATVASGPGPYPLVIPQPGDPESPIYITGPYNGTGPCTVGTPGCAPFGLTIVTHVLAGPFNLGTIVTRGRIEVDPHTAQVTITTNPLPQVVDGVPTDLRLVNAVVDRPGFMFNPTHCIPATVAGAAWGTPPPGVGGSGGTAGISSAFDVVGCKGLAFAPDFKVATSGKTSKSMGASLSVKILYPKTPPGSQATNYANIASVKADLPKQLPSRLTTLQKACKAAQFEADPAGCPAASVIGHARVLTPLLPVPVEGPAYFVSHGGEAFPSLIMVLQGYGVTVDLVGTTFISKAGITSSTFKSTPDVPLSSFELVLPEGKYSALAANGDLCTSKLEMPTAFVGQNGAEIHESTAISVTGCAKVKALTRAQKLSKALKACHAKRNRKKRTVCEATVHKRYGPVRRARKAKRHPA